MKIGDLVEIAWSLPMHAPTYNGKRGVVSDISNSGLILEVSFDMKDGSQLCLSIPNDCAKVITALDMLAEL